MYDKIEKIGQSVVQHGKSNDRIYLQKLTQKDYPQILDELDILAAEQNYTKIFAKVPEWAIRGFQQEGYLREAYIPNFYRGQIDVFFYSNFIDHTRSILEIDERQRIDSYIRLAKEKQDQPLTLTMNPDFTLRVLNEQDIDQLTSVYERVFKSYPFPIFEAEYIRKTMEDHIVYFGAFKEDKLVAASSAEMEVKAENAEMTDFATLPEFRGNNLSLMLLREMEAEMRKRNIKTLFTIARSRSAGMNISFAKMGYHYSGTLINNTNIAGNIESMNVWYKNVV